jgi:putative NADH-flavin reductase
MSVKLFVIGATGRTGLEILSLARARGHQVTAIARSPQKLATVRGITVVPGSPLRTDLLTAALSGHDAVLSVLGPPPREALRPSTLVADCARATVDAMRASGVRRLAIISAAVLFPERGLQFAFFRWLLRHHARDLRAMEEIVRRSGLAWTIARPPRLVASDDESFNAVPNALPPGRRTLSFRSVGAFMLDAVEQHRHVAEIVGLGPALEGAA